MDMNRLGILAAALAPLVLALTLPAQALAWSNQGHQITGAIAYDELMRTDPGVVAKILAIEKSHPDKARFDKRLGALTGPARDRMLFQLMARWPDDIREGPYDHPNWHYFLSAIADPVHPAKTPPSMLAIKSGEAPEAFGVARATVADAYSGDPERAIMLCWIFHLTGDIQQPLHAGHLVSAKFPLSDRGGTIDHVRPSVGEKPIYMHQYWDDRLGSDADDDANVDRTSRYLEARVPRMTLKDLDPSKTDEAAFRSWARESYALAVQDAYREGLVSGVPTAETDAPILPADYPEKSHAIAERRVATGGYRIADVMRAILK
jgi:hypothetical protein